MIPRSLRHRLEKAAKLLVIIQKHLPNADCLFEAGKGDDGHVQLNFVSAPVSPDKFKKLGTDLEGKGYAFTQKQMPWIGQISFKGKADDKTTIVMTMPYTIDRLEISGETPVLPYAFSDSK